MVWKLIVLGLTCTFKLCAEVQVPLRDLAQLLKDLPWISSETLLPTNRKHQESIHSYIIYVESADENQTLSRYVMAHVSLLIPAQSLMSVSSQEIRPEISGETSMTCFANLSSMSWQLVWLVCFGGTACHHWILINKSKQHCCPVWLVSFMDEVIIIFAILAVYDDFEGCV